jgi:hypothetical protein
MVIDTLSKNLKYIGFPVGTDRIYLDNVCYELDRETDTLTICSERNFYSSLKKIAPDLTNRFGLRTISVLKIVSMSLSFFLFFLLILNLTMEENHSIFSLVLISASIASFFVASNLYEIEKYCNIVRCKRCGRDFAYEEIKTPLIKMVSTYNEYEKTITSYLKCKYCNDENLEIEISRRNRKSRKKNLKRNRKTCKGCGKELSLVEYRSPDAHLERYNTFRTIRHYKCTNCGYMEISIKDEQIAINRI